MSGPPSVPPNKSRSLEERITKRAATKKPRRSLLIATAAVYAAIYVTMTLVFSAFSYGQIQLRLANIMVGLIPIKGWPAILGQTIGVFLANIESPLGPVDLVNVIPTAIFSWVLWTLRGVSVFVGLTIYSTGLGISVGLTLVYAYGLPLLPTVFTTTLGIFGATAVLGYILYRAVTRTGVLHDYLAR